MLTAARMTAFTYVKRKGRRKKLTIETINPISAKPRMNPFAQYLLALATIVASYSAYVALAVPILEGSPQGPRKRATPQNTEPLALYDQKSDMIRLFPADAWELGACKTLLIDAGTILFKKIDQQPDGSLHIKPFTLISGLEDSDSSARLPDEDPASSSTPTVLRCLAGAKLKFNKPLSDIFSGNAKMESARLSGRVDIYRPPSQPEQDDAVHVITSNVHIEKHRVFTLESLQFAFGPNQGSGRNMLIDLAHEEQSSVLADFSSIAGIQRLELAFLDELRIAPASKPADVGATGNDGQPTDSRDQLFANNQAPIEVTCSGPFVFDFQSKTASFQKQVVARQLDEFNDSIECDELQLVFQEKQRPDSNSETADIQPIVPASESGGLNASLELQQFVAKGSPAVVISRSQSAKISGDQLSYNLLTGQIDGSCFPSNQSMVTIVSPEYQLVAKKLTYWMTDDGSLGEIEVVGPGRILRAGGPDNREFYSTWKNGLTSRRVPGQTGLQSVVIDGSAQVRVANETSVAADRLEFLVWRIPKLEPTPKQDGKLAWEYQPSKLLTTGNVVIRSPKLNGQTRHLTASWPAPNDRVFKTEPSTNHRTGYRGTIQIQSQDSGTTPGLAQIPRRTQTLPSSENGRAFASVKSASQDARSNGFVEKPSQSPPSAIQDANVRGAGFFRESAPEDPGTPKQKLKFNADKVDARLTGTGDATEILDLSLEGNISIESIPNEPQNRQLGGTEPAPMTIVGHKLQLTPQIHEENYRVLATGRPGEMARVTAKGLILSGENINLDQEANKVWIEGAGTMRMKLEPPAKQPDGVFGEPLTQSVQAQSTPENLDVNWSGGMIFDGSKIYFEKDIEMFADRRGTDGNRANTRSLSQGLSVELSRPVQFQKLQQNKQLGEAKIKELIFVNEVPEAKQVFQMANHSLPLDGAPRRSVVIENRSFDPAGEIVEQQRISVPQAIANMDSGVVECKGPGTVSTHRTRKSDDQNSNDPFAKLASDDQDEMQSGIMYIQINFDGNMSIDANRRSMTIDRNIRTVYAPVQNWSKTFDPDRVPKRTPGTVLLTCDHLKMVQWTPRGSQKSTSEMIARGNTHILSETFEATADRVSYDKSTDQLVIVGTPRNDANLRFKHSTTDASPINLVANKITYRMKDKATSTSGIKTINAQR